jgi:hypothetical protein
MNKENRTHLEIEVEEYLESNNIYELFHYLTEQLVVDKPNDPLGYVLGMIEKGAPLSKRL